ncbi:MAG: hypothetical protein ACRDG8_00140 [Actinomycetota bacterium]
MEGAIRRAVSAVVLVGAVACSGSDGAGDASACPEGTTRQEATGGYGDGTAADTREDAIRAELQSIDRRAADEEIAAGVVASAAGSDGSEKVEIRTSDSVVVTMTLAPQNPGWRVERSTWCAPDDG